MSQQNTRNSIRYALSFILTDREYQIVSKLVSRVKQGNSSDNLLDNEEDKTLKLADATTNASDDEERWSGLIRGHSRLFANSYALILAVQVLRAVVRRQNLSQSINHRNATRVSTGLIALPLIYRTVCKRLNSIRNKLASPSGRQIRKRFRLTAKLLNISPTIPFISGASAGLALSLIPPELSRDYLAVYTLTRTLEFVYNYVEDKGYIRKPRFWGSWVLFPIAYGQLFHSFFFDPDCCPYVSKRLMSLKPS